MNWCCQKFKFHFELAGLRGLSICIKKISDLQFFLQFRVVDDGEFITFNERVPIVFAEESRIESCPWCGKKLSIHYKKIPKEFIHNELDISPECLNQMRISRQKQQS